MSKFPKDEFDEWLKNYHVIEKVRYSTNITPIIAEHCYSWGYAEGLKTGRAEAIKLRNGLEWVAAHLKEMRTYSIVDAAVYHIEQTIAALDKGGADEV